MEMDNGTLAVLSIIWILITFALISEPDNQVKAPVKMEKEIIYLDCDTVYIEKHRIDK